MLMTSCKKCGTVIVMGVNGIETNKGDLCDGCAGVVRGMDGAAFDGPACACYEIVGDNPECPVHGKGGQQ